MAKLVLPHGTAAGHGHGWKRDTPSVNTVYMRDMLDKGVVPTLRITGKVGFLDKADHPKLRNQLAFGSCTGHATRTAMQMSMRYKGIWQSKTKRQEPELSPLDIYLKGRIKEGAQFEDTGCEIQDVIDEAVRLGCALERTAPYPKVATPQTWAVMCELPSEEAKTTAKWHQISAKRYKIKTVDEFFQALANKMPVVGGFTCFTHSFDRDDGFIPYPQRGEQIDGGHAVAYLAADADARVVEFQNSWGQWGDGGYGRQEMYWFETGLMNDCHAIAHE